MSTLQNEILDRCLDELESLAKRDAPVSKVITESLAQLNRAIGAAGSAWCVPLGTVWKVAISAGELDCPDIECWLLENFGQPIHSSGSVRGGLDTSRSVCLLEARDVSKGVLLVEQPPKSQRESAEERPLLTQAFAEIVQLAILRQRDNFFYHCWEKINRGLRTGPYQSNLQEAGILLVNELRRSTDADRVTILRLGQSSARVLATSSVAAFEKNSNALANIEQFAVNANTDASSQGPMVLRNSVRGQVATDDKPVPAPAGHTTQHHQVDLQQTIFMPIHWPSASGTLHGHPVVSHCPQATTSNAGLSDHDRVPVSSTFGQAPRENSAEWGLVIEWSCRDRFLDFLPLVNQIQSVVNTLWCDQVRWFSLPSMSRKIAMLRTGGQNPSFRKRVWWVAGVVSIVLGSYLATTPTELEVEASGTLQPELQQTVFATHDGYIDQLMVNDGQTVHAGQPVATMRSPMLENRIEEIAGELRTMAEKRSGLLVAENQIQAGDVAAAVSQGRIAAEIREIGARQASLQTLAKLLDSERKKLELLSPIDGVVVAPEIQRNLAARPVHRGDPLFKIAAVDGSWRVEARVPDRDSGYVRNRFATNLTESSPGQETRAKLLLAAKPDAIHTGVVRWISSSTRNVDGTGPFVDLHISVDKQTVGRGQMGATVIARIVCNKHPWWFVQLRPVIEAVQRRFWF